MFAALSHSTGTPEMARHELSSGNVTEPVVTVLSVYVPSSLSTRVPVVSSEPVAGTVAQANEARKTSMPPSMARHDDATFQVPTTFPPQADTLLQFSGPPLVPLAVDALVLLCPPVL